MSMRAGRVGAMTLPDCEPSFLRLKTPEDLLALVPLVLGFETDDSLVMLTLVGDRQFHARVDMPADPGDVPLVVDAMLRPALKHRAHLVAFVAFTPDRSLAAMLADLLVGQFEEAGIQVLEAIRADDGHYHPLLCGGRVELTGIPYDVSNHPFVAHAVLRGQVVHQSRAALAATLDPDPHAASAVLAHVGSVLPTESDDVVARAVWARGLVSRAVADRRMLDDAEVARLLVDLTDLRVRDDVWLLLDAALAPAWVDFWTDVVRRAPEGWAAPPAALLGFGAWVSGHGALAWCAVDRSQADDPTYSLARLLADTLEQAVPPSAWGHLVGGVDSSHRPA